MKMKRKVDPSCDSDSDEEIIYSRVVTTEDCPCKDTYTFPEYETFVELHAHPLLSREMSTSNQGSTKKAKDKTRLIKEKVKSRKDQRQEENERKKGLRKEFEDTRSSKEEAASKRKKAKMDLASDCVQHKWCLLAQSCGMEAAVKKVVQAKMDNILRSMTEDVDTEEAQEVHTEEAHTEISEITEVGNTMRNDVDREEAHTEISAMTEFGNTDDTEDHSASESSNPRYAASPTTWQRTQATQDDIQEEMEVSRMLVRSCWQMAKMEVSRKLVTNPKLAVHVFLTCKFITNIIIVANIV
jgi:hypothetical protein